MTQSGIYEHFRGKLYFVLSGATHRDTPLDLDTSEVIYHPLYQAPNLGWRRGMHSSNFLGHVDREGYSGPRFKKIMSRKIPDILPGFVWIDPRLEIGETGRETHLTIFEIIPNNSHTIATVRLKDCDGELVERSIIYLITYCIFSGMVVEI